MTVYHRFTNGDVDTGCGFMMCSDDAKKNSFYGTHYYTVDSNELKTVSADTLIDTVKEMLAERPDVTHSYDFYEDDYDVAEELAKTLNPKNIVDSAGFWDNCDLVSWFYENYAEPNQIDAVATADGLIVFDASAFKLIGKKECVSEWDEVFFNLGEF